MTAAESGPPQRRPRRKPGENRELLIEAGIHEFGRVGYHGASTSAIARIAGVPQPHVYASFHTKQDLFLACCERAITRLTPGSQPLEGFVPGDPTAKDLEACSRMIFQGVAALNLPELRAGLLPVFRGFEEEDGQERVSSAIHLGAWSLLRGADNRY
ncbi:helix-turn-helix transcriptional regulator [Leucobacter insecticola]|uniref:Helix-turn-helix transcriptional regulator n=1 Tax=Leucobacter insecticola TaxID=2714934 RepID=A0A6G8FJD8_9MICO|nr:TetR/AcrR family transcriptional regulator [Leucobacter insecticola]QIM16485.1 helix-turn-helix transcriptional regulator [Leucobacter insecticola]